MKEKRKASLSDLDSLSIKTMDQVRGGQFQDTKPHLNQQQFSYHGNQNGYQCGPVVVTGPD